jgi:hypothetical protein
MPGGQCVRCLGAKEASMTPIDLSISRPRPARQTLFGFFLLPRTIDKLRAELPGGHVGPYLNHDAGFSAYVVKRLGLDMNEFRDAVARAADEAEVAAWLATRIDSTTASALNAKLESFVVERMSIDDQILVRQRHPVMVRRPELNRILDILDADDDYSAAPRSPANSS